MSTTGQQATRKWSDATRLVLRNMVFVIASIAMLAPVVTQAADESAQAIYHSDVDHLWNRLHETLFLRVDKEGQEYGRQSVDPWLWPGTSEFLLQGESHLKIIALLDEFITKDGASSIADPIKRAVLQHDLWALFDWAITVEGGSKLTGRLANAIGMLSLDDKTIAELPNNYQSAVASRIFATDYKENSDRPMLPADLFDLNGGWVCVRGAADGPSAPVHMRILGGRSPFIVYLKLPGGRQATLDYIEQLNAQTAESGSLPLFPVGTTAALVRQMMVINHERKLVTTPLVQSVQLRVYRKVGKSRSKSGTMLAVFKFELNRRNLFAREAGGLTPVSRGKRAPTRLMVHHGQSGSKEDPFESPRRRLSRMRNVMKSCIQCHMGCGGGPNAKSIFTYNQEHWNGNIPEARSLRRSQQRLLPTDLHVEQQRAIRWKSQRADWEQLRGLLKDQPE